MTSPTIQIILDPESRAWRRRLGPLPWAVLEELGHQAQPGEHGWVAPVGVRDLGAAIGVTKDTAARAITTLARNGIVTRLYVDGTDRPPRSGYRLHLPEGVSLHGCLTNRDGEPVLLTSGGSCPDGECARRLDNHDSVPNDARKADRSADGGHRGPNGQRSSGPPERSPNISSRPAQASLFDSPNPAPH